MLAENQSVPNQAIESLLVKAGLVTEDQLSIARVAQAGSNAHIDEILIDLRLIDGDELRRVMSQAWKLPAIDLANEWVDDDLVCLLPWQRYLEENWMPVRDQANGSVLIATAREPADERDARIGVAMASPVEFAVASSKAIRLAVCSAFEMPPVPLPARLYRALARPRD